MLAMSRVLRGFGALQGGRHEKAARVSVEAGATLGWERWVGLKGVCLGVDRFGASAPGGEVLERLGMTVDAVCDALRQVLGRTSTRAADAC